MPEPLPHEEETLEVVRTAARIVFGDEVTEDQCGQMHELIRHGFRLKGLGLETVQALETKAGKAGEQE